jgi:hypothetical protein
MNSAFLKHAPTTHRLLRLPVVMRLDCFVDVGGPAGLLPAPISFLQSAGLQKSHSLGYSFYLARITYAALLLHLTAVV